MDSFYFRHARSPKPHTHKIHIKTSPVTLFSSFPPLFIYTYTFSVSINQSSLRFSRASFSFDTSVAFLAPKRIDIETELQNRLLRQIVCSFLVKENLGCKIKNSRLSFEMDIESNPTPIVFSPGLFLKVPWQNHNWLEAMKSSSPTHNIPTKDSGIDTSANDVAGAYSSWLIKYPSAITSFEDIMKYSKGKRIALFLDYDGTLSPIVDNPDLAFMSDDMRAAVKNVAKYIPTAIISGRSRDKVHEFVGLQELYYAGSHGMDIMGPGKEGEEGNLFQPASEFLPMINEVFKSLVEITKDIKGAKVENNKFCVSVHYRNVEEKNWQMVAQYVQNILKHYPRLRLTHGRKVLEVRPVLKWDKGKAVEFLLDSLGLSNCDDVLPIYVGDDRTDEDAFKFLREFGGGFGILVSCAPKESSAFYSLRDPSEVMEFLKLLVMNKKSCLL